MSKEFKEKRSFDDILWNTFIVIMVIFLGYALLLPRIRHVVERMQGKKPAVVANAAPAQSAPETGSSVPAAQPSDSSSTPPPSSAADANSPPPSTAPPSSRAPSAAEASPATTAPHVTVNPPPAAHAAPEPREKAKSQPATKPAPASKPPVQTAQFQGRYAVDAGSYTIRSNAERLTSEMPGKYQPHTTITPVTVHGKLFYRVRVVVSTKAEADQLSAELLQKEKVHAVILALR